MHDFIVHASVVLWCCGDLRCLLVAALLLGVEAMFLISTPHARRQLEGALLCTLRRLASVVSCLNHAACAFGEGSRSCTVFLGFFWVKPDFFCFFFDSSSFIPLILLHHTPACCEQVNAHYDLAVCTEEIIGVIGLGQRFGVQGIPEAENQEHRDRQFLLKRRP